jgi:hypothetical protein
MGTPLLGTKNRNISCYVRLSFHKIYFILRHNAYKLAKCHSNPRIGSNFCVHYQHCMGIALGLLWQQNWINPLASEFYFKFYRNVNTTGTKQGSITK